MIASNSKFLQVRNVEKYDFSDGIRGKYFQAYRQGTNLVILEPDMAEIFKDSAAVNAALRQLAQVDPEYVSKI